MKIDQKKRWDSLRAGRQMLVLMVALAVFFFVAAVFDLHGVVSLWVENVGVLGKSFEAFAIIFPIFALVISVFALRWLRHLRMEAAERERAEKALNRSEKNYQKLVDEVDDGFFVCDNHGVITVANQALARIHGVSGAEKLVGKTFAEFIEPATRNEILAIYAEMMRTGVDPGMVIAQVVRPDRTIVFVEVKPTAIKEDDRIVGSCGVVRDVTARVKAEQQLHLLGTALESAANGITITDSEGVILRANTAFSKLTGYELREVVGKKTSILKSGKHDDAFYRNLWQTIASGRVWHGEIINRRKDGSFYTEEQTITPVTDTKGKITHYIAIKQDVTERKQAETSLQLFRSLMNQINDAIEVVDSETGRFIDANEKACTGLGYTREEFLSLKVPDIYPMVDQSAFVKIIGELRQSGSRTLESLHKKKDGSTFPVEINLKYVQLDRNYVVTVVRDITERKQAEEKLRESNRKLQEALDENERNLQQIIKQERLRALGHMASGIAHDFNNSLTTIMGYTELLLNVPDARRDEKKLTRYLEVMDTASKDAANIVRRLREFYRQRDETDALEPVNLESVVKQAISLTQPRWKEQARANGIHINVDANLNRAPLIMGSEPDLREMLTNLIFNAVDAMPKGGTITLNTRDENGRVVLEVADSGTGMTEEVRRRCLEPFFTTKGEHGTGMGLAMVYGIVKRHDATIDIESELGKGTTFVIQFPKSLVQEKNVVASKGITASCSLRVLVVDDEPAVCQIEAEFLRAAGHTVATASDGGEGLTEFRRKKYDVVVLDRSMPVMNGDQLASAIKQLDARTSVIMLTGFADMMKANNEKPVGVDVVLGKPVRLNNLLETVALVSGDCATRI
jgi:PAS domain S-box-containing protein